MRCDIADAAGLLIPHWYRSVWQYDLDDGRAMFRAHRSEIAAVRRAVRIARRTIEATAALGKGP